MASNKLKQRPFQVTVLGYLFIIVGAAALAYHVTSAAMDRWMLVIAAYEIAGVLGGVFLLRGSNWARWFVLAWTASHVVFAALNSYSQALPHLVLTIAIGYFWLGPAAYYFKPAR
jgi:uncharacterized membrane protein HdeD (DUF308 family)